MPLGEEEASLNFQSSTFTALKMALVVHIYSFIILMRV